MTPTEEDCDSRPREYMSSFLFQDESPVSVVVDITFIIGSLRVDHSLTVCYDSDKHDWASTLGV